MKDNRQYIRKELNFPLQIKALAGTSSKLIRNSFSSNISEIGLGIMSFDFFAVNEKVRLQVFSKVWARLIDIVGRVIWVEKLPFQDRYKIGVEFVDTTESLKEKIRRIMNTR